MKYYHVKFEWINGHFVACDARGVYIGRYIEGSGWFIY